MDVLHQMDQAQQETHQAGAEETVLVNNYNPVKQLKYLFYWHSSAFFSNIIKKRSSLSL